MTSQIFVWMAKMKGIQIPNCQVPRPNGFFSRAFRKIYFLGGNFHY